MTIESIISEIESLDDNLTVYAQPPWNPGSHAALAIQESAEETRLKAQGYTYLLEVFIAKEFAQDWIAAGHPEQELCNRLIHYAIHDA